MNKLTMINDRVTYQGVWTDKEIFGKMPKGVKLKETPKFKTLTDVKRFVGFNMLSNPQKMPEEAFNIPAQMCKAGAFMIHVKGSVCSICYAYDRGRYIFQNVKDAMLRRYNYAMYSPHFVDVMSWLINHRRGGKSHITWFRWFDSGDIQDEKMLDNICKICRATPNTHHWLPSKEWKIVTKYVHSNKLPKNLTIRLSGLMIDGQPPTKLALKLGLTTSTVITHETYDKISFKCPSSKQDGHCNGFTRKKGAKGGCRACWSGGVVNVPYLYH